MAWSPRAPYIADADVVAPALARFIKLPEFTLRHLKYVTTNALASAPDLDDAAGHGGRRHRADPDGGRTARPAPRRAGRRPAGARSRRLTPMPTFYCWHCYGEVAARQQVCPRCGLSAEAPEGTDYTERLIWALHHPLPDRRLLAAQTLGPRGDTAAIAPLRELTADPDPYWPRPR
jgi:hypothetical protein